MMSGVLVSGIGDEEVAVDVLHSGIVEFSAVFGERSFGRALQESIRGRRGLHITISPAVPLR